MAKTSGGMRTFQSGSATYQKRLAEVEAMRRSGKYSSVEMGKDNPNMMVYGGGDKIKELCIQNNVLYVEQFMANRVKSIKKGGKNG